jgi:hypothetical protein
LTTVIHINDESSTISIDSSNEYLTIRQCIRTIQARHEAEIGGLPLHPAAGVQEDISPMADDAPDELPYDDAPEALFNNLLTRVYESQSAPCMSEVLAAMFAWAGRHKATDQSAEDCWAMLGMLLPDDNDFPAFSFAKKIIGNYMQETVEVIDMCPCDRFAYMDLSSAPFASYKNAHRTQCPIRGCGKSRHVRVKARVGYNLLPRKVMYYLPLKQFLTDVFRNDELACHLHNDAGDQPPGAVVTSVGFYEKVTNNPAINFESRNQAIIMSSDGIPFFKDKGSNRKGYPCAARLANPPEAYGKSLHLTHLLCMMSCEYWEADPHTGKPRRRLRSPKCLAPMMLRIADELHMLYYVGIRAVDYSLHENNQDREFVLRCVLLFWIGDYPGQGETSGFK